MGVKTKTFSVVSERSYAEGYLPTVSGGKAVVVLPLLSESATGPLTVSVNLGDPALSPFLYRNYENIFTKKKCTAGGKTISCYPVKFSLKLAKARINGCYPVTFKTSGLTDDGEAFAQEFFVYVSINDGIDPHASEPAQVPEAPSPTPSQPKLMVTAYHLDKGALAAGEKGQLSITVRNTSGSQPVKNIKLSFSEDSGEIWPESTGAIYCAQIGAGSSYTWKFSVNALTTAQSRPHPAVITMEYEDNAGQPCSASDRIILQVRQPVRLEYEEPALPPRVTQGDYGRDARYQAPPVQIRTRGITSYGSYLGYITRSLWLGYGCFILALGTHVSINRSNLSQVRCLAFWLLLLNAAIQPFITSVLKASIARLLLGTAK
jgi:hypothetical protein